MKSIRTSLSSQMIVALLLLSVIPLAIIGSISFESGRQIIIENVQTHLKTVGILKRQAIEKWVENLQYSTLYLANDFHVGRDISLLYSKEITEDERTLAYNSLVRRFQQTVGPGEISVVSLINPNNWPDPRVIKHHSGLGNSENHRCIFVMAKWASLSQIFFLSLPMGKPTMVISCPVLDSKGSLLGVLAIHANFENLSKIMLERTGLSETTETFLVNKNNLLVTNTVFAPDGAFKKWIFGEGAVRALSGESDVDLFMDYRDKEVIGAYFWLPDRKLALIAKQDVAEAFAPIVDLKRKIIFMGLAIIALVICVALLFGKQIITPIKTLVAGTVAVGKGDLDYRINSSATNEIGILAKAFDQMAESLKHITISLDEKEILLREVHHRVKNNLQMVQSLLNLQLSQLTDETVVAPLRDSMNRITSIAMVHETLYKSDDLSTIDLDSYFQDLVKYLMKSIRASKDTIDITCHIEQVPVKLDSVISCGLIINELVTNAMKYAFVETEFGEISIKLHTIDTGEIELIISDNGIGIADFDEVSGRKTLGVDLVNILVENQLDGTVKRISDHGLRYIIRFPA